jgi:hypothetical protein
MPFYDYECPQCEKAYVAYRPIDKRHDAGACKYCPDSPQVRLVISPVRGIVKFPAAGGKGYVSATTGKYIDTERARRDDLKRSGCRPYEGFEQESKEAARIRAAEEKAADQKLHESVSRAYHQLPPAKKAVLNNEVTRQQEADANRRSK